MCFLLSGWKKPADPTRPFNRFLSHATKVLQSQYGYRVSATGGSFVGGVSLIDMTLHGKQQLDVDNARKELIAAVGVLQRLVASDRGLQPYLVADPFPIDGYRIFLDLRESYYDTSTDSTRPVALVTFSRGNVRYSSWDGCKERFTTIHKESYEDALRIVSGGE